MKQNQFENATSTAGRDWPVFFRPADGTGLRGIGRIVVDEERDRIVLHEAAAPPRAVG